MFENRDFRLQGIIDGSGRLLHREQAFPSYAMILGGGARKQLHDFEARTSRTDCESDVWDTEKLQLFRS